MRKMESTQVKGMKRKLKDKIYEERKSRGRGKKVCRSGAEPKFTAEVTKQADDDPEVVEKTLAMIKKYGCIRSSKDEYKILKFLGEGAFGEVAKCLKGGTKEFVALKIAKKDQDKSKFFKECSILCKVSQENPDKFNIVRNVEKFIYKENFFIAFEILEKSLLDFMLEDEYRLLSMHGIQYVTQQLLVAHRRLTDLGIIHGDLKPENIMLVNHQRQPFKIKVIDFGLSIQLPTKTYPTRLGTLIYRAPEIILGMKYCETVDMWSIGCIVAEMLVGEVLYSAELPFDQIRLMDETQGPFPDYMLEPNEISAEFLCQRRGSNRRRRKWRIKKQKEYMRDTGNGSTDLRKYHLPNLDALFEVCSVLRKGYDEEDEDRKHCVNMIKNMLRLSPEERILPDDALECHFIQGGSSHH